MDSIRRFEGREYGIVMEYMQNQSSINVCKGSHKKGILSSHMKMNEAIISLLIECIAKW